MNLRIPPFGPISLLALILLLFMAPGRPVDSWALARESINQAGSPAGEPADRPPMAVTGAEHLEITIEQAIQLALTNNRDVRVEEIRPVIAGTFAEIERGIYDPELFADMMVGKEESRQVDRAGAWSTIVEEEHIGSLGLRRRLLTGTEVEVGLAQDRSTSDAGRREHQARVGLTVTQALLRGFGPTVNLVGIRRAELEAEISRDELRAVLEALVADTEGVYWDYVLTGQEIDIFERSLAIARRQLDEIEQRIEVGTLPRLEAAAALAEVARREQALIDVRARFEENRLRLLRLINPGPAGGFDYQLTAASRAEVNPLPLTDLADRLALAEKSRADLNEARLRLRQNRLETVQTRNGLLPKLDLFIAIGKTGYGASFADSFRELDGDGYDVRAGIRLTHQLNNRQARARDLAARSSQRQAVEAVENLSQLVELDVRLALNEFERARQQIAATRATRFHQDQTLLAETERFAVGASTALLVAQAQRDLLASALDEVEAIITCQKALVHLYLVEGSLLARRGIRLDSPTP